MRPSCSPHSRHPRRRGAHRVSSTPPETRGPIMTTTPPAAATASTPRRCSRPSAPSATSPSWPASSSARRPSRSAAPTTAPPSAASTAPAASTSTGRPTPPTPTTRPCSSARTTRPTPAEHLLQALGACLTSGLANIAAARGIELGEVTARVEGDIDLRGILGIDDAVRNGFEDIRVTFHVSGAAEAEQLARLVRAGPRPFRGVRRAHQRRTRLDRRGHRLTTTRWSGPDERTPFSGTAVVGA